MPRPLCRSEACSDQPTLAAFSGFKRSSVNSTQKEPGIAEQADLLGRRICLGIYAVLCALAGSQAAATERPPAPILVAQATDVAPVEDNRPTSGESALKRERLNKIEKQLETNVESTRRLQAQTGQKERELNGLRARLIETADRLREAEDRANQIENRLADLTREMASNQDDLQAQNRALSDVLAALQSLELAKPPALAISPDDAAEAARAALALSTTAPDLVSRAEKIRAEIIRLKAFQEEMDIERQTLGQTEAELKSRRAVIRDLLSQKEAEFQADSKIIANLERENKRLAAEVTSIQEVLNELGAQSRSPSSNTTSPLILPGDSSIANSPLARRPDLAVYANLPKHFAQAKGTLPYPITGRITGTFQSVTGEGTKLDGLNILARSGAVVTAPFRGSVAFAGNLGRLGTVFILDVGDNHHLVMIGLGQLKASVGQEVAAGEPIGYMPSGPRRQKLYFEIRHNRKPKNPSDWLRPLPQSQNSR